MKTDMPIRSIRSWRQTPTTAIALVASFVLWSGLSPGLIAADPEPSATASDCEPKNSPPKRQAVKTMPPATRKQPVVDTYHGVPVTDDYRWLEDSHDEAVRKWSDAQNLAARSVLDGLPHVEQIRERVSDIMLASTVSYSGLAYRGGRFFVIVRQPPRQQPFLAVMTGLEAADKRMDLVDPNALDKTGATSIDWYLPSPDGSLVAVSLSRSGTESGDVHLFDTATGRQVHEVVPGVNSGTAGGDLAWSPDGAGFYYTRHLPAGEPSSGPLDLRQHVYFHKLGTSPESDRYELGKGFPAVAEIEFEMHESSGTLLATVQNGDGGEFAHYLRQPAGQWAQFSRFDDKIVQATFGPKSDLYLIAREDAPRGKILRMPLASPDAGRAGTICPIRR